MNINKCIIKTCTASFLAAVFLITTVVAEDAQKSKHYLDKVSLSGLKFRSIGPAVTSGRISAFAVNPANRAQYFVASASGGVWKTDNNGTTYEPVFDGEGSYSIGCVTIDPNNPHVVWIGTGENNNQRSVAYGDGVYKSMDGGESWQNMGLKESEHIGKIIVDPRDSDVIYVAAIGPLWSEGGDRGVYKTIDGGASWERVMETDEHTGATDLVMDPRDPDVLYAAAHQRRRHVFTLVGGGPGSAIYKSRDGGETWEKLDKGLPSTVMGRIGLVLSPADADVVYAIIEASEGEEGFYRSLNRGASWKKMSDYVTSGNYYQEIVADPKDVDRVYSMNTWMHVTEDGGKTWNRAGEKNKHVDNHALWIDPEDTDFLLAGCDGGIYESFDGSKTWNFKSNLPVTQFYKVSVDDDRPFYNVYGGTQDNYSLGGPSRTTSSAGIVNADWFVTLGGDGFETQVDPDNSDIVYSQWQYGNLTRYDKASGEKHDIKPRAREGEDAYRWNWDAPLQVGQHFSGRLYFAANKLFRSDDRGNSWDVISDDLTKQIDRNKLKVMGRTWGVDAIEKNRATSKYGTIVAFHESPVDGDLLYVGTDDGLIQVTENSGGKWKKTSRFSGVPENTYVNMVLASQHERSVVYAAFNNHKRGDFKPYILKSTNNGRTWKSIAANLPQRGSVYSIAEDHVDPALLFVGTEFGVFFTVDGGKYWKQLKTGVPTIAVRDLAIQKRENDLVLGTFGRGFYILDDYSPLRNLNEENLAQDAAIFPVKDALMFVESSRIGGSGKGFQGDNYFLTPNPPVAAVFTYYLKEKIEMQTEKRRQKEKELRDAGKDVSYPTLEEYRTEKQEEKPKLVFTVRDSRGNIIRRLTNSPSTGINRITWDFLYVAQGPISEEESKSGDVEGGVPTAPGEYTVTMEKRVEGEIIELAGPVSFQTVSFGGVTLPTEDREELAAFQRRVEALQAAVRSANREMEDLKDRLKHMKAAASAVAQENETLLQKIKDAKEKLHLLDREVRGDRLANELDMAAPLSVTGRINRIVYGMMNSTSAPTQTQRDGYQMAKSEFEPVLAQLETIASRDIKAIERKLDALDAPYTPGRLPKLKN